MLLLVFSDLNLLDWSCNNHLAVALGGFVYLWNAASGDIVQLCQTETPDCYIGAVSWIKEGNFIALGDSSGTVQVPNHSFCITYNPSINSQDLNKQQLHITTKLEKPGKI